MPRVTAIIPTYNWSSVLPFSIGSVLDQTLGDFELLVTGDGCTDDSAEVVAAIGDARVRWINLPENTRHQSGPNNEALRQARGEMIAYLGHDDLWLPHHLEVVVASMDEGADLTTTIVAAVRQNGSVTPRFFAPEIADWMPPTGIAHRRTVTDRIGGWRHYRELDVDPEVDLLRRARAAGFRIATVPRLTAVKFPAATRKDVYRLRPTHEQAEWLARIRGERDLEQRLLAAFLRDTKWAFKIRYRELWRRVWEETRRRLRARLPGGRPRRSGASIDVRRRFKGLDTGPTQGDETC